MITFCVGTFVPITMEGNILVDGVLASCYPSTDHDMAHFGMTPVRWFPKIIDWIFGEDTGFQVFVGTAEEIGRLILPHGQF